MSEIDSGMRAALPPAELGKRLREAETLLLTSQDVASRNARSVRGIVHNFDHGMIELYSAWHAAEPGKGYDVKAAEWQGKLEQWRASTQPATTQPATGASATQ